MITNKELLTYEYYLKRMSLFLNNAVGIKERVEILVKILNKLDNFYDELFNRLNITDDSYNQTYLDPLSLENNLLDKIGAIFDCYRSQTILVNEEIEVPTQDNDLNDAVEKYITLNNQEFLLYIKLQIIKQHFDGTREQLRLLYGGENTTGIELKGLHFIYVTDVNHPGTVNIYWLNDNTINSFRTEFRYMFFQNLLTIESLGIIYNHYSSDLDKIAKWQGPEDSDTYSPISRWQKPNLDPDIPDVVWG